MDESWTVTVQARSAIVAHAERERPRECCGLLVGTGRGILEAVPLANLAATPTRFLLDPKGHIDARRDARRRGLHVIGFYHSHPFSKPEPSAADAAEVSYPELAYAIVSLAGKPAELRLFRWRDEGFREVRLETIR